MKRKLTREQAIKKLKTTGKLSTDLLEPLGISFESFLALAQRSDSDKIEAKLVEGYISGRFK